MTPTDALAIWINGFFALAAVSGLLSVAALVALVLTTRNQGSRTVSSLPVLGIDAGSSATDRAA